jgi:alcohol dehydrogenase (NADP+)
MFGVYVNVTFLSVQEHSGAAMSPASLSGPPIDPAAVPQRELYTGAAMPAIGMGTFGSDHVTPSQVAEAVRGAAAFGYRHFDCASVYGNETEVGVSFESIRADGVEREQLWVTSKLWNDKHAEDDVIASCRKSLADLRLDYLDLYLVHWPFPNFHPPGCDVTSRSANAQPYIHENYMKTWRKMEELVDLGLVRHIGTSNMTIPKLKLLLRDARIKPAVNEMELHPHFQQHELFQLVVSNGIQPIGYCPIGSPGRPERDRAPEDTAPTEDPVILKIAQRHRIHPAVVCIKWAVQRGQTPIPFSINNYRANLAGAVGDPLSDEEMQQIASLDRNCRLIKGQVFLWKDGQSWEDLWDIHGAITPP